MILNASIHRLDAPAAATAGGQRTWTNGASIEIRCLVDAPTRAQRISLSEIASDVSAVIYVGDRDLVGLVPAPGGRMVVAIDGEAERTSEILHVIHRVKPTLSHYEVFTKEMS